MPKSASGTQRQVMSQEWFESGDRPLLFKKGKRGNYLNSLRGLKHAHLSVIDDDRIKLALPSSSFSYLFFYVYIHSKKEIILC